MKTIGVIGGGTMGAGIAQVAAMAGDTVFLLEVDRSAAEKAIVGVQARLDRLVEKGRRTAEQVAADKTRLRVAEGVHSLAPCDVVIEAVVEDLGVKAGIFQLILQHVGPQAILATNTSSLSIGELGEHSGAAARLCGMHFFNPAPLMPLVEVIAGSRTAPATIDTVFDLATRWGKSAVRVKDTPGFIVNRVARPFYLESLRAVEEGQATCDRIDAVMKETGGFRMGPFELMDLIGIDINYAVTCSVYEQSGRPARFKPSSIQEKLVEDGRLGRKTGAGIYKYEGDQVELLWTTDVSPVKPTPALRAAWEGLASAGGLDLDLASGWIFGRVLCALMNEAATAADEGVASDADIDLAMQKGTNYPHGPLAWAAAWGHPQVGAFLKALNETVDDNRFAPARRFR